MYLLILNCASSLGNNKEALGCSVYYDGVEVIESTHGRTTVDKSVGLGVEADVQHIKYVLKTSSDRSFYNVSLGKITADGEPVGNNGAVHVICAPYVVNCLAVEYDDSGGDGKATGLYYTTCGLIDKVDLVTHRINVGKKLDGNTLAEHLTVSITKHMTSVLLNGDVGVLNSGVFHDDLCATNDLVHLFTHEHEVCVDQGLALCTVDYQKFSSFGKLSVGRESCTTRADDTVFLHYFLQIF